MAVFFFAAILVFDYATGQRPGGGPNQPVEFDFADGTKLDVTLANLSESCGGNNCLGTYNMSATFDVLNGPVTTTPLPATLPLFAGGLGFVGFLAKRRKTQKRR